MKRVEIRTVENKITRVGIKTVDPDFAQPLSDAIAAALRAEDSAELAQEFMELAELSAEASEEFADQSEAARDESIQASLDALDALSRINDRVPEGGTTGQVLTKQADGSNDWEDPQDTDNAVWGLITGDITDQADLISYIQNAISAIPVPTATSELINDSGFITTSALLGYATESYVDTSIQDLDSSLTNRLDDKVDKEAGKQLSDENYTLSEKEKLANLADVAISGDYNDLINTPSLSGYAEIGTNGNQVRTNDQLDGRYLQSFTESDPTVPLWVKSITQQDIDNWNSPSLSASWGSIIGTLSDQTDLQTALNGKIDTGNVLPSDIGLTAQNTVRLKASDDSWIDVIAGPSAIGGNISRWSTAGRFNVNAAVNNNEAVNLGQLNTMLDGADLTQALGYDEDKHQTLTHNQGVFEWVDVV